MEVSKKRLDHCKKDGDYFESLFKSRVEDLGLTFKESSQQDDWYRHIDCYVDGYGVDVKGNRRLETIWLEITNVNGNKGWLRGEAYYVAVHIAELDSFSVYLREDLLNHIKQNATEYTEDKRDYNKFYTRSKWGKKDILVKYRYEDIKHLEVKMI
tara:strand:+ start:145 stop:609 length:465 start_codon:yes stop_codon:yes gene_type:complete